jgi:site-specific DNA recombinase
LADVRAAKIDIVLVYKVDRLTRSLADFAKLIELFDAHNVSFVSVTHLFRNQHLAKCAGWSRTVNWAR